MFIKKIRKDNRGIDISLVGTSYSFVLIIIICAMFDLILINFAKMAVVTGAKECAMYALAKNFKWEMMMYNQTSVLDRRSNYKMIEETFSKSFAAYSSKTTGFASSCGIVKNGGLDGSGVTVDHGPNHRSIVLSCPSIKIKPRKILNVNTGNRVMLIGQKWRSDLFGNGVVADKRVHSAATTSNYIMTGVSCKLEFFEQHG